MPPGDTTVGSTPGRQGREGRRPPLPRIFTVNIRNANTRTAYSRAAAEFLPDLVATCRAPNLSPHVAAK